MLQYRCIIPGCINTWEVPGNGFGGCSISGICPQHTVEIFTPKVRRYQLREGNFDCFGKAAGGYCDRRDCAWRQACLNPPGVDSVANLLGILTSAKSLVERDLKLGIAQGGCHG